MADKNQGAGHDAFVESEKRLDEALEKISAATRGLKNSNGKAEALEAQNSVLENGLRNLTTDYEKLSSAFQEVSEKIKSTQNEPQENTSKVQEDNETLREELKISRQDHEALKDSFSLLKQRYAEIEEAQEGSGFSVPNVSGEGGNPIADKVAEEITAERDALREELEKLRSEYSRQIGENELLVAEAEAANLAKKTVADSLDNTINRLEGMLNTNETAH